MLRAVNKRFSARSRSGRRKTLRPGARCRWWSARQRRSVAVSPDYPELGRVQWVVEYRREPATEDMPRKPVAGKARRRIGHWGVRYRPTMMSHLVNADGLLCPGLRIQGGYPFGRRRHSDATASAHKIAQRARPNKGQSERCSCPRAGRLLARAVGNCRVIS